MGLLSQRHPPYTLGVGLACSQRESVWSVQQGPPPTLPSLILCGPCCMSDVLRDVFTVIASASFKTTRWRAHAICPSPAMWSMRILGWQLSHALQLWKSPPCGIPNMIRKHCTQHYLLHRSSIVPFHVPIINS